MRIRSLGLAIACGLVLTASYPAGKSAAQVTVHDIIVVRQQERTLDYRKKVIADHERAAREALAFGNCSNYQAELNHLNSLASRYGSDNRFPERTRNELAAQAQGALASLPAICDPDPFIRSQLERDAHSAEAGGGEDAN
jgi:hypothetical protein